MASDLEWHKRYIKLAHEIADWTSCLSRKVGCIITVDRRVVATGYNGAPAGVKSCKELGYCLRNGSPSGQNLEVCQAVHAEQNALMQAAKFGISVKGGDMYITTYPCATCMKLIINSGIKRVFYTQEYPSDLTKTFAEQAGIELIKIDY